jgi:YebC/PmpR family DNA-binding regulatory protein
MAGHSKWKNIQHRKGKQDAIKGKIFTKLIRALTVAAKNGGGDVNTNPTLRLAMDKALANNMTRDTIDRAVKRGAGGGEDSNFEEVRYEGYGPAGVAVLVFCATDNRNRTAGEVRHAFTKAGGNMGTEGSVSYLFKQQGLLSFPPKSDEDAIMREALEAGAEDVITNDDGSIDVLTSVEDFATVKNAMEKAKLNPESAEISFIPSTQAALNKEDAEKVARLIELLEDLDDVQNVYSNAEFPEDFFND